MRDANGKNVAPELENAETGSQEKYSLDKLNAIDVLETTEETKESSPGTTHNDTTISPLSLKHKSPSGGDANADDLKKMERMSPLAQLAIDDDETRVMRVHSEVVMSNTH